MSKSKTILALEWSDVQVKQTMVWNREKSAVTPGKKHYPQLRYAQNVQWKNDTPEGRFVWDFCYTLKPEAADDLYLTLDPPDNPVHIAAIAAAWTLLDVVQHYPARPPSHILHSNSLKSLRVVKIEIPLDPQGQVKEGKVKITNCPRPATDVVAGVKEPVRLPTPRTKREEPGE